jgi:hypothetical protein
MFAGANPLFWGIPQIIIGWSLDINGPFTTSSIPTVVTNDVLYWQFPPLDNDVIYLYGKVNTGSDTYTPTAYKYDHTTLTWVTYATNPATAGTVGIAGAGGTVYSGKMYVVGGYYNNAGSTSGVDGKQYVLDLNTNTWSSLATRTGLQYGLCSGVGVGDFIYYFGGIYGGVQVKYMSRYQISTNTWSTLSAGSYHSRSASSFYWNGNIVISFNQDDATKIILYNISGNSYTYKTHTFGTTFVGRVIIGDVIYGYINIGGVITLVSYNLSTDEETVYGIFTGYPRPINSIGGSTTEFFSVFSSQVDGFDEYTYTLVPLYT